MGNHVCSFCGKNESEVDKVIVAPSGVAICDHCVGMCMEVLENDEDLKKKKKNEKKVKIKAEFPQSGADFPKPVDMKKTLDDYVIGQETAKKVLLVVMESFLTVIRNFPRVIFFFWGQLELVRLFLRRL